MDAVTPVIQRLEQTTDALWRDVKTLLALSDLDRQATNRTPTLFVLALDEKAKPDVRGSGPALQSVTLTLGVIIIEQSGNRCDPDLLPLRETVRRRLFGWAPDGFEPLTLAGGRLLSVNRGQVAWIDQFNTEYTEDANHGS